KDYIQEQRSVDASHLDVYMHYRYVTRRCFGMITGGSATKQLYFIAPVLMSVCTLFGDDEQVKLIGHEDLGGASVRADAKFEFMLQRGKKVVCVVEEDDMEQGIAEVLIGCEVVAEMFGMDIVYAISTNFV
ncbi:hypothetical protein BJ742DRAFT_658925, partial [Cladochytrium replicatum]